MSKSNCAGSGRFVIIPNMAKEGRAYIAPCPVCGEKFSKSKLDGKDDYKRRLPAH